MRQPSAAADSVTAMKCELAGDVLRGWGQLRLRVNGWSMLPSILPGDTLHIESAEVSTVSEGDVVLLVGRDRRLVVHRLIAKSKMSGNSQVVTRGDSMPQPDPPASENDLLGKVAYIVRKGKRVEPRRSLRLSQRAVAALVRRSSIAGRVVVGIHGMAANNQT